MTERAELGIVMAIEAAPAMAAVAAAHELGLSHTRTRTRTLGYVKEKH